MALIVDVVDFAGCYRLILPSMLTQCPHLFHILAAIVVGKGGLYAIAFAHA